MTIHSIPVLIKDPYRIVAVTADDDRDRDRIIGYVILNAAGARLRQELTLDEARSWMERCIDEDNVPPSVVQAPKTRGIRR